MRGVHRCAVVADGAFIAGNDLLTDGGVTATR